jgi:hypothetical protein
MPCVVGSMCKPMTRGEAARIASSNVEEALAILRKPRYGFPNGIEHEILEPDNSPMIMCGDGMEPSDVCACAHFADYLCDWPVGRGKTCDIVMCDCCGTKVGDDKHLCAIHLALFDKDKPGSRNVAARPWPPRK